MRTMLELTILPETLGSYMNAAVAREVAYVA